MRDREKLLTDDEWGQIYQRECRAEDELSRIANQFTYICATNGDLHQNQNYVKAFREIRKHLAAFAQSCVEREREGRPTSETWEVKLIEYPEDDDAALVIQHPKEGFAQFFMKKNGARHGVIKAWQAARTESPVERESKEPLDFLAIMREYDEILESEAGESIGQDNIERISEFLSQKMKRENMNEATLKELKNIVISTIGTYTGPTGGWLGSPSQVEEDIYSAICERFEAASPIDQAVGERTELADALVTIARWRRILTAAADALKVSGMTVSAAAIERELAGENLLTIKATASAPTGEKKNG